MTTKAADDFDSIARRLQELEAEKSVALTGSSVPAKEEKAEDLPHGYGDYLAVYGVSAFTGVPTGGASTPYTVGQTIATVQLPPYTPSMGSLAHPNWPYAGTGFEWRKFVRS